MHEFILGFVFLGMIVAPSLVAARTGKTESEPDSPGVEDGVEVKKVQSIRPAPVEQMVMPASKQLPVQQAARR